MAQIILSAAKPILASPNDISASSAPPCFYWSVCSQSSEIEKAGRSVCRRCAANLRGLEYPLRDPCAEPIYFTGHTASEALDMLEDEPRPVLLEDHDLVSGCTPSMRPASNAARSQSNKRNV